MTSTRSTPFFIVSCARSGSTSLCEILNLATNGRCALEPAPNLNRETRDAMEGRLTDPRRVLEETVLPRVRRRMAEVEVYGEKNVTYGPFIPYLHEALRCRFVFIKRDGRDVVRSLVNWHEGKFGTIYRECRDPGVLSPLARATAGSLPVHLDAADYARPRPARHDPLSAEWEGLTRAEMCAYYWSRINELYLEVLQRLPAGDWIEIDYTSVTAADIERVAAFCGLRGITRTAIDEMLARRINSLGDRGAPEGSYPDWKDWDGTMRRRFDTIAAPTMTRLGYYRGDNRAWRPADYGSYWERQQASLEWYEWMYDDRKAMHEDLVAWVGAHDDGRDRIGSILEFGCGLGVGYTDAFADRRYVGVDMVQQNIDWCRGHRVNPRHEYVCADFAQDGLKERFDLVFSSGTLDNCYDIDLALAAMVRHARKWIYVVFYRGWFPELNDHQYRWNPAFTCFDANAAGRRIRDLLVQLGCRSIQIEPVATRARRRAIPFETRVIARVAPERGHG